jgi:tRNA (cytidine/uridine-2'-O-)-methyltransferase
MSPLFEVALVEPEIPNNTGNIGRTCVAAGCRLHRVHPLGFVITEKACRRAGLDYWPRLDLREHASWDEFAQTLGTRRVWMFTTKARRSLYDVTFTRGDMLMFGKETKGPTPFAKCWYPNS